MFQKGKIALNNTDIKVIVGLIALAFFLACAQIFIASPGKESLSPAKGGLVTHYFGNAAMELPESWKMESISATFYPTHKKDGPQIIFREIPPKAGEDVIKEFGKRLETIKKSDNRRAAEFGTTDLSEILGRPALIAIEERRGHSYGFKIAGAYTNTRPENPRLDISLELATPQAILNFKYLESINWPAKKPDMTYVADKQEALINWALTFIVHYQWIGNTSPQSGKFLATKFGRIEIGDDPAYQRYNLTADFSKNSEDFNELSVSLNSLPGWTPNRGAGSQKVVRHPEEKGPASTPKSHMLRRAWSNEVKHIRRNPSRHDLEFTWHNGVEGFYSPEYPSFNIAYYGSIWMRNHPDYSTELVTEFTTEAQALWMTVLDTLRILPDSD